MNESGESLNEFHIIEHIAAKDFAELLLADERIQHDVDVETFGAVSAPTISLCTDVTAAETFEIEWRSKEALHDTILI